MTTLRRRIPTSALGRARMGAMIFASIMVLVQLGHLGNPAHPPIWIASSAVGLLVLVGVMAATYRRGSLMVVEPVLVPGLVALAGSGLRDSVATFGLCIAATVAQSMYGSVRLWMLRTVLLCAAFLTAIAVSPYAIDGRWVSWHSAILLIMVPQLVMMNVLVRGLYLSLLRQSQASERDAVLAHAGSQLIGVTDLDQVRQIGAAAAARLSVSSPGTVTVVLEHGPAGVTVVHGMGIPNAALGTVLPAEAVSALDAADTETVRTLTVGMAGLEAHTPGVRHWRAVGLGVPGCARYLLVGGARPVSVDVVNAFRNLGHQLTFAEANCRSHQTLDHQANHDHLTRLPNRARFFTRLGAAIDEQVAVTLLIIDLDDFKVVNDTFGHAAGDELLIEVATRLLEAGGPTSIAARFGGDEFAVLLTSPSDDYIALARRLCQRLMEPMRLTAGTVTVGASIGVATATAGLTAGDLMRCADVAMYSAKARGKNRVELFTPAQHGDVAEGRLLEEYLAHAAERDEIVLRYQPYLDLNTNRCIGIEATAHWQHPTLGFLPPENFIPVAERTGLITVVGADILHTACRHVATFITPDGTELPVAVNVTGRQLLDPNFSAIVRQALADAALSPTRLVLEIVEADELDDPTVKAQLEELAETGVRIALDGFGVGDASLTRLRSVPVHQVKIHPNLLALGADPVGSDVLHSIRVVAEIFGLEIVAAGVDTAQQAELLRATTIAHAQGLHLAAPMPAHDVADWLARTPRHAVATNGAPPRADTVHP